MEIRKRHLRLQQPATLKQNANPVHSGNLYLVFSASNPKQGKLGYWSGEVEDLMSRFITDIPDLIVHSFFFSPVARTIENGVKRDWAVYRKINSNGNPSEWYMREYQIFLMS